MTGQSDEQAVNTASSRKRYIALLLEYVLKVCLPAAAVVLLANLILTHRGPDDTQDAIRKAYYVHNYIKARDLCRQEIDRDFFNLSWHRTYLDCCLALNLRVNRGHKYTDQHVQTEQEYTRYTQNSDPNVADIGYYGLGYYYSLRKIYPDALAMFEKVRNKNLKFLNNSIGHAWMESGNDQKAEPFFHQEILNGGNIDGAYYNLASIYYRQKDFSSLNRLVSDEQIREYIPERICRRMDLKNRQFGRYIVNVFSIDYLTFPAVIAAAFVSWIWFNYLRKLDVFEPEKAKWLLNAFVLGMAFSMLCGFLYDMFDFTFGLTLDGSIPHELMYCILRIGLIEESVKIIPFLFMLKYSRQINESIDYIIYAAVCALGFAFMENLIYFQDPGLTSITSRTLWSVVGHMTDSAMVAYGLFYVKYRNQNKYAVLFFLFAFASACILHGLYDFFLMARGILPQARVFSLHILLFSILLFSYMIRNALNQSEFNFEKQKRIEGLSTHLVYSLSIVVLLQYLLVGWRMGIDNANFQFYRGMVFNYVPLIFILICLGAVYVQKGHWIPLFENKKKRAGQEKASDPDCGSEPQ